MSERIESSPPRRSGSLPRTGSDSSGSSNNNLTITLRFSRNSVFNVVISSPDNEIMYEVSTNNKYVNQVTTTFRMDPARGERTLVGEVDWTSSHTRARVRVGFQTLEWMLVNEWLENPGGWTEAARVFTCSNGAKYRWKRKKLQEFHLTEDEDSDNKPPTLAIFREPKRNALLKIIEPATFRICPGLLPNLDHIIVSLLVMEARRRGK
ncbi:hypothetical protein FRB94_001424 [Tulasnella sp. JGI-2019a]|nr:hypothetical protein FRB94_001424 [Tulasnella sp. JGI-2019a]KAG9037958.1 hypothetical protein FRB95_003351 [Tulasnella sp. JGI-2019a]